MTRIRDVLIVAHAHHDVGYTDSPRVIMPLQQRAVGEAIRLASGPTVDDPTAFRWTLENARPVVGFLGDAEASEIEALVRLTRSGRISVTGGYANMTELVGHEELIRSFDSVDSLRRVGLAVRVVQYADVNGLPWGTVPAMVKAGLDVLVMALNPNHGRPPFEQPSAFWWEGPDGSKVLVWLSLDYGLAETWGLLDGDLDGFAAPLAATIDRLEARDDYPFDFVMLHATDDNGWPTRAASDGVRAWNARHPERRLMTATIDQAMDRARLQAARARLPVWRGEWADWWAHGHGSSAYEVGVSREARSLILTAETALSLARLGAGPEPPTERRTAWRRDPVRRRDETEARAAVASVYEDLLLFDEHTWGADESVSRPESTFTRSHWNAKAGFAFAAFDAARDLAVEGLWRLSALDPTFEGSSLLVFNAHHETRSGTVALDIDGSLVETRVRDVPGFGWVRIPLATSDPVIAMPGTVLETDRFRIVVDPERGGIVSLVDKRLPWDLLDPDAVEPLGAVIVEALDPTFDHPVVREGREHFRPETPGPRFRRMIAAIDDSPVVRHGAGWSAISWTATAPTLPSVAVRLTVDDGADDVLVQISLVKEARVDPEGVYVAFPFALFAPTFWLETAGAVYRADIDQLPGTCRDWYSIGHAAGITDGRRSVLWTTDEAPLVQLGRIHTGEWSDRLDAPVGHIYAWLMNNLYATNFKASQGGPMSFAFSISAHPGPIDADDVRRRGQRAALPLTARLDRHAPSAASSQLAVESADVVAVSLVLDRDPDSVVVRLEASARGSQSVSLAWTGPATIDAWHADVFGHPGSPLEGDGRSFHLPLGPLESATVLVRRSEAGKSDDRG